MGWPIKMRDTNNKQGVEDQAQSCSSFINNPFFLLLKLPQINPNKKDRIGVALPVFYGWAQLDS